MIGIIGFEMEDKMKRLLKNIIDYLWRWSNTHLSLSMQCTFCGQFGMWLLTMRNKERYHICDKCYKDFKYFESRGYKSSYWGGLGHK